MSLPMHHPVEPLKKDGAIIADLMVKRFHIHSTDSVLDLGCNNGQWLEAFIKLGISDVIGVDGGGMKEHLRFDPRFFVEHDLSLPLDLGRDFDLAFCIEVAEHLPESAADILVKSLVGHSDLIIFSAATPGQGGYGHLNEQPFKYWQEKFEYFGHFANTTIRNLLPDTISWWLKKNLAIFQWVP